MAGSSRAGSSRLLPLGLALGLLAVVVLAGLLPNTDTGIVSASTCTYGNCPSSSPFPLWAVSAAAVIVVLAIILALLLLRRGRRRPPPAEVAPAATTAPAAGGETWTEGQSPESQQWSEGSGADTGTDTTPPDGSQ